MDKKAWFLVGLLSITLFSACISKQESQLPLPNDKAHISQQPTVTPIQLVFQRQNATPTPKPPISAMAPPTNIPSTGIGAAPYGPPPPMTNEEIQLTQQLFALMNSDRAVRGLYPFTWNPTLAGGARLHSWNMFHCGFSHTCPDGHTQCQRIADEGFAGYTDCGENIGYAGPFPTPYAGMHNIQESMVNEPPTGWHRIHLLSTTLHRVGVGIYVDPQGYIWFTEDLVS